MKRLLLFCLIGLVVSICATAQSRPNFSGNWKLDPMRSRLDKIQSPKSATLSIEHMDPKISMESTSDPSSGPLSYRLEATTDGVEAKQLIGDRPCSVVAQWGNRTGERLIVETTCESQDGPVVTTRVLKLGSKGKMLTTVLTIQAKGSQKQANEFYSR